MLTAGTDPRSSAASVRSLEAQLPAGSLVALTDADDASALSGRLAATDADYLIWLAAPAIALPDAVARLAAALERFPSDLAYGDGEGRGGAPVQRPDFSPIRLRSQDYLGDLRVFRVAALRAAGGFDAAAEGAHGYDQALRIAETLGDVLHVPEPLARRDTAPAPATDLMRRIAAAHLARSGIAAEVGTGPGDVSVIRYPVSGRPLVSIVIPTRGSSATIRGHESVLVLDAVRGILERSTYTDVEIVVVADDATPPAVLDQLAAMGGAVRVVGWSAPFNFSAKVNRGAAHARGEYLVLLNDDVELITDDWLEVMLGLAQQPGVGLVGTMLYFEDGSIQHGGHLHRDSSAGHIAFRWPADRDDALASMTVDREVSGVTAACAMVSRATFHAAGGLSALFPGNYNDVDFSLKVRGLGLSAVWTPHARLYHFESKTRVATIADSELARLRERWNTRIQVDAYWP